jgi:ribonuclease E
MTESATNGPEVGSSSPPGPLGSHDTARAKATTNADVPAPKAESPSTDPASGEGVGSTSRRRRGSRGGRSRGRSGADGPGDTSEGDAVDGGSAAGAEAAAGAPSNASARGGTGAPASDRNPDELPERSFEGKPRTAEAAEKALVRRPRIGDSRPAPADDSPAVDAAPGDRSESTTAPAKRRRGGRGRGSGGSGGSGSGGSGSGGSGGGGGGRGRGAGAPSGGGGGGGGRGSGRGSGRVAPKPVEAILGGEPFEPDDGTGPRRGRERNGRPVGRYMMTVSVRATATQIAVLEGRSLIEHYVSRPSDDVSQIHGNIYLGRVQNVLPGMEAAFVDIATPKNAVLYRGDVQYEAEDIEEKGNNLRIEQMLKPKQMIVCQVTKNPIAHKGARLTQEVSIPGRFVVLIPNSTTYGISKRLADDERKRLRGILDRVRPKGHGIIVRTAAEGVSAEEIERDVARLQDQWGQIEALAQKTQGPALLYREPDMAVRVIREEFNDDYRGVVIDDRSLYEEVRDYVGSISPTLADRVQFFDPEVEQLPLFERHHVHEQLHKALDRKVWLPSGGSLIIEHTEALTVIDVNTGKNVGTSNLEETVFRNNLEAAIEISKQLRLRDIGGIIVIDFIDMEIRKNREEVIGTFRDALARDKTRTQVFDISELGLVEMTRKRIGEGLLESFSTLCPECEGRGLKLDADLLM